MKEHLAVPTDHRTTVKKAWTDRMQKIASFGTEQCRLRSTVHSAICTIQGTPEKLIVNLACTAKSEEHVTEHMNFVNDTLLPQMEQLLGIQFEVRNLQFAVAGRENLLAQPEHLHDGQRATDWLENPFIAPTLTPAQGLRLETRGAHADLSMA